MKPAPIIRIALPTLALITCALITPAQERKILDEIRSHSSGVSVWWLGHNGWLIKAGGTLIGTDLVLEEPNRRGAASIVF